MAAILRVMDRQCNEFTQPIGQAFVTARTPSKEIQMAEKSKPAPKENKKGKKLQGKSIQAVRTLSKPFNPVDG